MPRKPRLKSQTGVYHVYMRGINKQTIFEEDRDCVRFIRTLYRYRLTCHFELYAYCLMGNHFHLLLKEGVDRVDQIISKISGSYVFWYNHKYERTGSLFQDRFGSVPVETDAHLLSEIRYILRNPVKAGLVKNPIDYPWSNLKDYLRFDKNTDVIQILSLIDKDLQRSREGFIQFVNNGVADEMDESRYQFNAKELLSDRRAIEIVKNMCGTSSITDFQHMETQCRNAYLRELKRVHHISIRQLVRITGISRGIIARV